MLALLLSPWEQQFVRQKENMSNDTLCTGKSICLSLGINMSIYRTIAGCHGDCCGPSDCRGDDELGNGKLAVSHEFDWQEEMCPKMIVWSLALALALALALGRIASILSISHFKLQSGNNDNKTRVTEFIQKSFQRRRCAVRGGGRRSLEVSWRIWTTVSSTGKKVMLFTEAEVVRELPQTRGRSQQEPSAVMGGLRCTWLKSEGVNEPVSSSGICSCSPAEAWPRSCSTTLTCSCSRLDQESLLRSQTPTSSRERPPLGLVRAWSGVRRTGPPISVCRRSAHRGWWPACGRSPSHPEPSPSPGRTGTPGAPGGSPTSANAGGETQQLRNLESGSFTPWFDPVLKVTDRTGSLQVNVS